MDWADGWKVDDAGVEAFANLILIELNGTKHPSIVFSFSLVLSQVSLRE